MKTRLLRPPLAPPNSDENFASRSCSCATLRCVVVSLWRVCSGTIVVGVASLLSLLFLSASCGLLHCGAMLRRCIPVALLFCRCVFARGRILLRVRT